MSGRNYYEILGVDSKATPDEIKRAYRTLAKQHHPDRNPGDSAAESRFKEVQQAYSVVGDPKKREEYDRFGAAGVGQWSTDTGGRRVYRWGGGSAVNVEDLEDLMSAFGGGGPRPSIFDDFAGAVGGRRGARRTVRGADEELPVSLSFEQAIHGTELTVRSRSGQNGKEQTIHVKIPPGVADGQRIRVSGRGSPGRGEGPPGDLYLICSVRPHPYFRREGADLYVAVPVTVPEAVLGAKIQVPSIDGPTLVTLPAGTPSGAKLRLKGRGLVHPGKNRRGDQILVIQIVPKKPLSAAEREGYEKLAEMDKSHPRAEPEWQGMD
jgi:DnaJ-class molecular chaperone